ncbi:MAG: 4-(cytidine 5'-diphospho)-2-C-methyl-D-erythritol kinase, partial [Candidatus Dadabacteria bacterium]|nr:4-(cytidine 5'-diphospho)-2-C-methyl-D-erythritol kinase [Candidatus Dadabacteria bacterium]NIT13961.1 4-(cytidine 5'-diphospho)-2-C-methyl-D-erythritol kinase [Candidatus Dadabacteria bacterium]
EKIIEIAASIGADVPFFIDCRTSLTEGIGEKITVLKDFPLLDYIIVKPTFGLSTADVYKKWDEIKIDSPKILNITETIENYK